MDNFAETAYDLLLCNEYVSKNLTRRTNDALGRKSQGDDDGDWWKEYTNQVDHLLNDMKELNQAK